MTRAFRGIDLLLGYSVQGEQVWLSAEARRLHTWIPGRTGSGKSRLLTSAVWQDILGWSRSRHGVVLLDPDGEVYDELVKRMATDPASRHRPVVLIDLRRDDHVVAFNLLRRHEGDDPAVTATNLLEALSVAYGDTDVLAKPTLYRTAVTILRALIEANLSLAHAPLVLDSRRGDLREKLSSFITDPIALANLARINQKSVADKSGRQFDEETLAFANRMFGPLSNRLLRHMFGQTTASFSFDWVLDEGAIVLVSLATEGNKVSETDARLVGALVLADLWQCARRRGKRAAGAVRGCYVYVDEFQTMLTPTIAAQLSRARGYGLYFTLANQLVSQLGDNGGKHADAIYHAVIGNTANKIVFRASTDEADLRPLSRALFLSEVDTDQVKDEFTSFQVVDHMEVRERLRGGSSSRGTSRTASESNSRSEGYAHASSAQFGSGSASGSGLSTQRLVLSDGEPFAMESESNSENWFESSGEQESMSSSETSSTAIAKSKSRATAQSWAESVRLVPVIDERITSRTYESVDNQLFCFDQQLATLPPRCAWAKLADIERPLLLRTLDVPDALASAQLVEHFRLSALLRLPFALSMGEAEVDLSDLDTPAEPLLAWHKDNGELQQFARRRSAPDDDGARDGD